MHAIVQRAADHLHDTVELGVDGAQVLMAMLTDPAAEHLYAQGMAASDAIERIDGALRRREPGPTSAPADRRTERRSGPPDATGSRLRATVLRQEFVLLQELLDQVGKDAPGQGAAAKWNAGDIPAADSGEMANDLIGFVSAEDKPWISFVGDTTVSLNGPYARPHELGCAVQMREFVLRPALPVGPHVGKESCPASHRMGPLPIDRPSGRAAIFDPPCARVCDVGHRQNAGSVGRCHAQKQRRNSTFRDGRAESPTRVVD